MNNLKGILFDFGGTIDTNGIHWSEMIWMAFDDNKIGVKKSAFEKAYVFAESSLNKAGIDNKTTFYKMLYEKINLQLDFLQKEKYLFCDNTGKISQKLTDTCYNKVQNTIEEQKEVLIYLKSKYKLGLVSNFYGNLNTVIKEFKLENIFTKIIDSHDIGIRKPDPLIWEAGIKLLELGFDKTLVVGDSYTNDIAPAKCLGCKAIWLKGKSWHNHHQFEHYSADKIIGSLKELKSIL